MSIAPVDPQRSWFARFVPVLGLLAAMWLIRIGDFLLPGDWNTYGIRSWDFSSLFGIATSPLLHSGFGHLMSNSVPFLILGLLVATEGSRRFWTVTAIVAVIGGIGTWLVAFPGTVTVGASGLVFGYFGYLVARGLFVKSAAHRWGYLAVAVVVVIVFGGAMFQGILPIFPGISWQGHLFGGIGGVVAAGTLSRESGTSAALRRGLR